MTKKISVRVAGQAVKAWAWDKYLARPRWLEQYYARYSKDRGAHWSCGFDAKSDKNIVDTLNKQCRAERRSFALKPSTYRNFRFELHLFYLLGGSVKGATKFAWVEALRKHKREAVAEYVRLFKERQATALYPIPVVPANFMPEFNRVHAAMKAKTYKRIAVSAQAQQQLAFGASSFDAESNGIPPRLMKIFKQPTKLNNVVKHSEDGKLWLVADMTDQEDGSHWRRIMRVEKAKELH